jgi:hypothetical protein
LGGVWVVCCVVCVLERKREREERGEPEERGFRV